MGTAGTGAGPRLEMARTLRQKWPLAEPEANVDPTERIRLEELARVAELQCREVSGPPVTPGGSAVEILAVGPGSWAWHTVEDWQFLLTAMTGEVTAGTAPSGDAHSGTATPPGRRRAHRPLRTAWARSSTRSTIPAPTWRASVRTASAAPTRPISSTGSWRRWGRCCLRCSSVRPSATSPGRRWGPTSCPSLASYRLVYCWFRRTSPASQGIGASLWTRSACGCA